MPREISLTPLARGLRQRHTFFERLLWGRLRDRRLGGWKFKRQMPIGRFIVDFCCPDAWLVVELDGGQHSEDRTMQADEIRRREIETAGYLMLRFWNREIVDNLDGVCETILVTANGCR